MKEIQKNLDVKKPSIIKVIFGLLAIYIIPQILVSILFLIINRIFHLFPNTLLEGILSLIIIIFLVYHYYYKSMQIKENLNLKISVSNIAIAILAATAIYLLMLQLNPSISHIPMSDFLQKAAATIFNNSNSWLQILYIAIAAPIAEELIFREIFLKSLLTKYSVITSILISAALFAISHGVLRQMPLAFIMGLLFGWIFVRTKSLTLTIILHCFTNSLGFILIPLIKYAFFYPNQYQSINYIIAAMLVMVIFYLTFLLNRTMKILPRNS